MGKKFNIAGTCNEKIHYMVNIDKRLELIEEYIDNGDYFSINRARQYGKTTTLNLLRQKLQERYTIFFISFEGISDESYQGEDTFCRTFCGLLYDTIDYREVDGIPEEIAAELEKLSLPDAERITFRRISNLISALCKTAKKPVVLIIDEVDQAGDHEVFLDFLGMLRNKYLSRDRRCTFQSVILAGVYDVRNLKLKIRSEKEHQKNSPWNIAAQFTVDMSFSKEGIAGMLKAYAEDQHMDIDTERIARMIYDYTSGYPFLVSNLCKIMDERIAEGENKLAAWTKEGFLAAVKIILLEKNALFESMIQKLADYPELRRMIHGILFNGEKFSYNPDNSAIDVAMMFGFVKNVNGTMEVANRIFETRLYNFFLSEEEVGSRISSVGAIDKNQFIRNNTLDMNQVLKKFAEHWKELYDSSNDRFVEDNGRKFFLLYLRPIINGAGNYYIEAQTRDKRRTDVIVDYLGRQYIVEIKIWHGNEYNRRGEEQLAGYLDAYHAEKGYLLSFNFNKNKKTGWKEIQCGEKVIFEVVV